MRQQDARAGCERVEDAIGFGDVVLVAIPFHAIDGLQAERLAGKIVIDANNYFPGATGVSPNSTDAVIQ